MIFVDSCIPMYLVGADHPHKRRAIELVESLVTAREQLVTSAEAFQEIIHRYRAIDDLEHLHAAYDALGAMAERTESITRRDTDAARSLVGRYGELSSRDCLHVAVMQRIGCQRVWTYDAGFDLVPSLVRVY